MSKISCIIGLCVVVWISKQSYGLGKTELINQLIEKSTALQYDNTDLAKVFADSALKLSLASNFNAGIVKSYYNLGIYYKIQGQVDSSIFYYKKALSYENTMEKNAGLFKIYNSLGIAYKNLNNIDSAMLYFNKAQLAFDPDHQEKKGLALLYNNIGNAYKNNANYDSSLIYFFKGLTIMEAENPMDIVTAQIYYSIGNTYQLIQNREKAIEYLNYSVQGFENNKAAYKVSQTYTSIGNVHYDWKDFPQALLYYKKALSIQDSIDPGQVFVGLYSNIGSVFNALGLFDSSTFFLEKALYLSEQQGDQEGILISKANLADNYLLQKRPEKSLELYYGALRESRQQHYLDYEKQILQNISEAYTTLNRPDSALHYYMAFTLIKDSIFNLETSRQMLEVEEKYRSEQQKKKISQLKIISLQDRQRSMYLVIGVSLLLVSLVVYLIIQRFRNKDLTHRISKQSLIQGVEKERSRISKELHDQVGSSLSMARLMISASAKHSTGDHQELYNKASELVKLSLDSIRKLSHELSPRLLELYGLEGALKELTDYVRDAGIQSEFDCNYSEMRYDPEIELALYRSVQELVNNVLKHSQAKTMRLILRCYTSRISIQVIDDGIGFSPSTKKGIGLVNIRARIEPYKGKIKIDSLPNQGCTIQLEVFPN